ncbi:hypothetical protein M9H77_12155 [Catharanthus roseus]|uniref:Uncharacterized protein n=1 Tax=Catharanthus roseus TaxID=4058 RepID=A0ACC0BGJ8_CATRO|nr:hypothetical protein M9H77_12155 [Catharanthus roseus]
MILENDFNIYGFIYIILHRWVKKFRLLGFIYVQKYPRIIAPEQHPCESTKPCFLIFANITTLLHKHVVNWRMGIFAENIHDLIRPVKQTNGLSIVNTYETPSNQGYSSGYDLVFGSEGLSDGVDDSDSREWIHLKRGIVPWRAWPNRSTWTPHHAMRWDGRLVESQEGLETKVGPMADLWLFGNRALVWCLDGIEYDMPEFDSDDLVVGSEPCASSLTVALSVSLHSGVEVVLMCLDSLRLPNCARNPHVGSSISFVKMTKERSPNLVQLNENTLAI